MNTEQDFDAGVDRLAAMADEELFRLMATLEKQREDIGFKHRDTSDVFERIALVETAIEDRFPGQLLAPYKDWQQRRTET